MKDLVLGVLKFRVPDFRVANVESRVEDLGLRI